MSTTSINYSYGNILQPVDAPPLSISEALYSGTAPVITNTQSANTTLAGGVKWAPDPVTLSGSDKRGTFTYLGAGDFINGTTVPDPNFVLPLSRYPNTYASGQGNFAYEFMFYGQTFELKYKYISTATQYRLSINDRKVTDLTQAVPGPPSVGSSNVLKVDLGSVDMWKIRFEVATMPFGGVFTFPGDTVFPTLTPYRRVMGFGDSITDGSAQNAGAGQGTWLKRFGRLIGTADTWDQSRGGTGYITPGTFATLPDRAFRDVCTYSPDAIIMWAGYNDQSSVQTTLDQITRAFNQTVDILRSNLPSNVLLVVGGVWQPTGVVGATSSGTNDTLRAAAFARDLPFVDMISGKTYDSFERVTWDNGAPWITTANASTFVGADNVHPNDAGHKYLAYKWAQAFSSLTN